MALNIETFTGFNGRVNPSSAEYIFGSYKNKEPDLPGTGTLVLAEGLNDIVGFLQGILYEAGAAPNNTPDSLTNQQYLNALKSITYPEITGGYDYITSSGYTLTLGQINLTTDVTGALPVANGGTGATSLGAVNLSSFNNDMSYTDFGLTDEARQDFIAAMFTGGTHSGVSVNYDDITGVIDLTATGGTGLTFADVGGMVTGNSETGGISVTYDSGNDKLDFALTSMANGYDTSVDGQILRTFNDTNVNIGYGAGKSDHTYSVVIGGTAGSVQSATESVIIGYGADGTGGFTRYISIGYDVTAGADSVVVGRSASGVDNSVTIGESAITSSGGFIALGRGSSATNTGAITIGGDSSGINSISIGGVASGTGAISIGSSSSATGINDIVVGGGSNSVSGDIVIGATNVLSSTQDNIVIGPNNSLNTSSDNILIGSGRSANFTSGSISIGTDISGTNETSIGTDSSIVTARLCASKNVILGPRSNFETTGGTYLLSLANGTAPTTVGDNSIAMHSTDISAGNTTLALYTEGTPVTSETPPTGDSTIQIMVNGTLYKLHATAV